jgi:hypothetical protein
MATYYRSELQRAVQVDSFGNKQQLHHSIRRVLPTTFPSEEEWKVSDITYDIGVRVGYAKGFVHATTLLFVAVLVAAVLASL